MDLNKEFKLIAAQLDKIAEEHLGIKGRKKTFLYDERRRRLWKISITIIVIIRFLTIYNHILDEDIAQIEKNIRERTGQTPMWST